MWCGAFCVDAPSLHVAVLNAAGNYMVIIAITFFTIKAQPNPVVVDHNSEDEYILMQNDNKHVDKAYNLYHKMEWFS